MGASKIIYGGETILDPAEERLFCCIPYDEIVQN